MDLDIAEFAVEQALSLGAKYADVRLETTRTNEFILKNGIPSDGQVLTEVMDWG